MALWNCFVLWFYLEWSYTRSDITVMLHIMSWRTLYKISCHFKTTFVISNHSVPLKYKTLPFSSVHHCTVTVQKIVVGDNIAFSVNLTSLSLKWNCASAVLYWMHHTQKKCVSPLITDKKNGHFLSISHRFYIYRKENDDATLTPNNVPSASQALHRAGP